MIEFYQKLGSNIIKNLNNHYNDNYDQDRFGPAPNRKKFAIKKKIKNFLLKDHVSVVDLNYYYLKILNNFHWPIDELESLYNSLGDTQSKELLIDLISFKVLGNTKVKLKTNTVENNALLEKIKQAAIKDETINPNFLHFILNKFDLNQFGKDIKLYFTAKGILVDFFIEQYKYESKFYKIMVNADDIVIDAGGCWGDTALYFADKVGSNGKVYSFEFIPNNLEIFKKNWNLNPRLKDQIQVIDKPIWNISAEKVYYKDFGPGSKVEFENFKEADGNTETISIDDFVKSHNISKLDFIKMDIEGSEMPALEGARNAIQKYKPKLAIAIYHSPEDFVQIPKWILNLDLGYKIYLGHYTIHAEETVVFAAIHD